MGERKTLAISQKRDSEVEPWQVDRTKVDTLRRYALGGTLRSEVQVGDETLPDRVEFRTRSRRRVTAVGA